MTEHCTTDKEAVQLVREMVRRAGHEIRNALSGVAVNVEVVHGRAERGQPGKEIASFADRARLQVGVATAVGDGILSLVNSVLAATADGTLKVPMSDASRVRQEVTVARTTGLSSWIESGATSFFVGISPPEWSRYLNTG